MYMYFTYIHTTSTSVVYNKFNAYKEIRNFCKIKQNQKKRKNEKWEEKVNKETSYTRCRAKLFMYVVDLLNDIFSKRVPREYN